MLAPPLPTAFADFSPRAARSLLIATAITSLFLVAVSQSAIRNKHLETVRDGGGADIRLYQAEVARVQQGEGYYQAAGKELRARGFATHSVFNWRPPLLCVALAAFPSIWFGRVALALAAVAAIVLGFQILERQAGSRAAFGGALLLVGALLPAFMGDGYVLHEMWAGTLIALSVCAFGVERRWLAVAAGIAALFIRELAGLYCVVCLALAIRNCSWKEAATWCGGLAAYAVCFGWHAHTVLGLLGPHELAQRSSWLQFAGAPLVLATSQMNCLLLMLPQWATGVYLPLAMLGFLGWRTPFGERAGLVTAAYLIAFAIVGQPFNQYWGVMITPLMAFGFARMPASLHDLWQAARWSERLGLPATG